MAFQSDLLIMTEQEQQQFKALEERVESLRGLKKTLRRNFQDMVGLLVITISQSNNFLGGHIKRVAELSKSFSEYLRFDKETIFRIYYGALLHDLGMVGMPQEIVSGREKDLKESEIALYRKHPLIGEKMISTAYDLKQTARIIRGHHEEYGGDGYPDGTAGKEIPIGARLVRFTNDYDNYIFKNQIKASDAASMIKEQAGYIYDPSLARQFVEFIKQNVDKQEAADSATAISIADLQTGMYIAENIVLQNGMLLIPKGLVLDDIMLGKIRSFDTLLDQDRKIAVVF